MCVAIVQHATHTQRRDRHFRDCTHFKFQRPGKSLTLPWPGIKPLLSLDYTEDDQRNSGGKYVLTNWSTASSRTSDNFLSLLVNYVLLLIEVGFPRYPTCNTIFPFSRIMWLKQANCIRYSSTSFTFKSLLKPQLFKQQLLFHVS